MATDKQPDSEVALPQRATVAIRPYYEDSHVVLYHGQWQDVLPIMGQVEAVFTDPPFSDNTHTNAKSNRDKGYGNKAIDFTAIDFTAIDFFLRAMGPLCARWLVATMDWRHISRLEMFCPEMWEFVRFGVWVKTNPMPQISSDRPANGWDGIAYLHKSGVKKSWNGGGGNGNWIGPVVTNGDHPTGKPVEMLASWVERFTTHGDLILDPFAGSGTTGVAAKRLGRRAVLIERKLEYCEVAASRLRATHEQPAMFTAQEMLGQQSAMTWESAESETR